MKNKDFEVINNWNLKENPFKSIEDYSELKNELRWLNKDHRTCHLIYYKQRIEGNIKGTFDDCYDKDISYRRWKYSMLRKAWYIIPLCWDEILEKGNIILDLGCGDGDIIQRLINLYHQSKLNKKIHFIGLDSIESRIETASMYVSPPHKNIKVDFLVSDITNLKYPDKFCDYSLCVNVLELMDEKQCDLMLDEMCRITRQGIYVVDLYDDFPGGYVRTNLEKYFELRGFCLLEEHIVFSEPFHIDKLETLDSGEKPLPLFRVKVSFFVRGGQW